MAVPNGFDFALLPEGEITIDVNTRDINTSLNYDLKIQLAYNRIKSITNDWFIDNIGANLEEFIGKACSIGNVKMGKQRIAESLTYDGLWDMTDVHITSKIENNCKVIYTVYLKVYKTYASTNVDDDTEIIDLSSDPYSYEITAELDLVKGVYIRYGWRPRRTGNFAGIDYKSGPRPIIP